MDFLTDLESCIPSLRRYARALLRDAERADDLVQDCLERALSRRHLWRGGPSLRPWLFKIMHNLHANQARSWSTRPRHEPIDDADLPPVEEEQTAHLALGEMAKAVASLPAEQGRVVLLVALEGLSYQEVAEIDPRCTGGHGDVAPVSRPRAPARASFGRRNGATEGQVTVVPGPVDEAELHAWADRRLGEERRAAVAAWLEAHPEDRRRVNEWQRQNELIERLWGSVAQEPIPARLSIGRLLRGSWRSRAMATAAALTLLAAGAAGGWAARGLNQPQVDAVEAMADSGLEAHRLYVAEKRHPVEVGRSEEQHLVTWLSRRLDRPLTAPDLKGFGLQLLGGRLLPLRGEPAAQLMYEDGSGGRYTLFVTRGRGEDTAFRVIEQNGVSAFYWVDHDTAYALIGSAPRERLLEISREIYAQLERANP